MQNNHKVQYIQLKLIQWTYSFSRDWITALSWKKKHTLSNRNLVNLTEFYHETDFVLLNRETSLYLRRCKKPCSPMQKCPEILKVVTNLLGREKCLGALCGKTWRHVRCDMYSDQNLWERLVLALSGRRILEEVKRDSQSESSQMYLLFEAVP